MLECDNTQASEMQYEALLVNVDAAGGVFIPRTIREKGIVLPLIGIAQNREADQRTIFLEQGGNDLLVEPVNYRELLASIAACVRLTNSVTLDVHYFADKVLKINLSNLSVRVNGEKVHLTGKEFGMLSLLTRRAGRVISKESFMDYLYGNNLDDEPEMKIIDVFICKARKKLDDAQPGLGQLIETVWGRGYKLNPSFTLEEAQLNAS